MKITKNFKMLIAMGLIAFFTYNFIFFSLGGIIGETLNLSSAIIGTLRLDRKKKDENTESTTSNN